MANMTIRQAARDRAVFLWQLAERLGISDSQLSRKLRHELPASEQARMMSILDEIVRAREEVR